MRYFLQYMKIITKYNVITCENKGLFFPDEKTNRIIYACSLRCSMSGTHEGKEIYKMQTELRHGLFYRNNTTTCLRQIFQQDSLQINYSRSSDDASPTADGWKTIMNGWKVKVGKMAAVTYLKCTVTVFVWQHRGKPRQTSVRTDGHPDWGQCALDLSYVLFTSAVSAGGAI